MYRVYDGIEYPEILKKKEKGVDSQRRWERSGREYTQEGES